MPPETWCKLVQANDTQVLKTVEQVVLSWVARPDILYRDKALSHSVIRQQARSCFLRLKRVRIDIYEPYSQRSTCLQIHFTCCQSQSQPHMHIKMVEQRYALKLLIIFPIQNY
jgi:hypothetical protein